MEVRGTRVFFLVAALEKNKVVDVDPVTDPVSCVSTSTVTQDQSIVCEWIGLTMIECYSLSR